MNRWVSILGVLFVLGVAYLASNNRSAINKKIIAVCLLLQAGLALLIYKTSFSVVLEGLGHFIVNYIDKSAQAGAHFVFGFLVDKAVLEEKIGAAYQYIFFFNVLATLIFITLLVNILYYTGLMQRMIAFVARLIHKIIPISGSEAISAIGSALVGQVEAQILIRPYLKGMTLSELLCSMSGSLACISGSIMIAYISMGISAVHLIAASFMAIPGSILVTKMVFPETQSSETRHTVRISVAKTHTNFLDAIVHGCGEGFKIAMSIMASLIGFIALIYLIDLGLAFFSEDLRLGRIFSWLFYPIPFLLGVEYQDIGSVSRLLGTKIVINEFVAFMDLKEIKAMLSARSVAIASIAVCSFANFTSVGIQIGAIGALAPERRADLARLGLKALFCATLVSYLSASIVGLFY